MSLPKRDGVNDRYYLIHKPDTSPEVLAEADACIQDILDGTARENHAAYPTVVRNQSGTPFLPSQLLERYLFQFPLKGFPYRQAGFPPLWTRLPPGTVLSAGNRADCDQYHVFSEVRRKNVIQIYIPRDYPGRYGNFAYAQTTERKTGGSYLLRDPKR